MFKSFLDLIRAVFGALGYIGGKVSASAFTALVCAGGFILQTTRFGLWPSGSVGMVLWLALLWFLVWLFTTALIFHPTIKAAATLLVVVSVLIILQTISHLTPGMVKGAQLVVAHKDQQVLKSAETATVNVIKPFACDRTNAANISFFGQNDAGEKVALVKYTIEHDTQHVLCFRESGVYDKTGELVKDITLPVIDEIKQQEPPESPKSPQPQLVHVAEVVPSPTPNALAISARLASYTATGTIGVNLEAMDFGEYGFGSQVIGTLAGDIVATDGTVLATAGSPVSMMFSQLELDRANTVHFQLTATSLSIGGHVFPVRISSRSMALPPQKTGLTKNTVKGALGGLLVGTIAGAAADGKRGVLRGGTGGAVIGAGAGALLTKNVYRTPPGTLHLALIEPLVVPASYLSS